MSEVAPAGGGPNRLFVVIAAGLVGLLVLGLLAAGGVFLISQTSKPAATPTKIAAASTATRVVVLATSQPTVPPTDAPASPTLVVPIVTLAPTLATTTTVTATTAVTKTVTGTVTPAGGTLPTTGLGDDLLWLAAGVVLVLVIIAARRVRTTGAA